MTLHHQKPFQDDDIEYEDNEDEEGDEDDDGEDDDGEEEEDSLSDISHIDECKVVPI